MATRISEEGKDEQAVCITILMELLLLCPVAVAGNVMHHMIQITIEQGRIFLMLCRSKHIEICKLASFIMNLRKIKLLSTEP